MARPIPTRERVGVLRVLPGGRGASGRDPTLTDEELIEELSIPTYQVQGEYIRVMDKDTMKELLGRSPNKADALCLTFAPEGETAGEYDKNPLTGYRG